MSDAVTIDAIRLSLENGVDINAFNDRGETALHGAAGRGADAVVRFLVEQGARLDLQDKQGRTPLDVALGAGGRRTAGQIPAHESTAALLRELAGTPSGDTPNRR